MMREVTPEEHAQAKDRSRRKFQTDLVSNFLTLLDRNFIQGIKEAFLYSNPNGYAVDIPEEHLQILAEKSFNKNRANILADFISEMKSIRMNDDVIADLTNLPVEEIENYKH